MAKKKLSLPPRRKRMTRPARLQSAKKWMATYSGKDPVRGYANWYAVDALCAIAELRILGIHIPEERREQALKTQEEKAAENRKRKELGKEEEATFSLSDSDDTFESIAGYCSGGAPYGIEREGESPVYTEISQIIKGL